MSDESRLDLSDQCLNKIPRSLGLESASKVTELHLDNNELEKLEHIEQFKSVVELSANHNRLKRMIHISHLHHIVKLDLSYNHIFSIEGLRGLVHLKVLNLSNNKIKGIDNLHTNLLLEHLDLSENNISALANISTLNKLKRLLLSKNCITQLKRAEDYLPLSLETFSLAGNKILDLNEISYLVKLTNLREIQIVANPCVQMTANSAGFDYRPFLVNWCVGLKVIDGFAVDDIESLKAEWLYSQGRGRQFRPGQHAALVQYLVETCPLTNSHSLQSEHERKLRLILSKAIHHQRQLQLLEQTSGSKSQTKNCELMTRSLDPNLLDSCKESYKDQSLDATLHSTEHLTRSLHCDPVSCMELKPDESILLKSTTAPPPPLPAASKLVPVPESLVSPMVANPPQLPTKSTNQIEKVSTSKLQTIKNRAQQKREKKIEVNDKVEQAAICIQKIWRGYHTRNLNPRVLSIYQHLQTHRTYQYIQKLSEDMEATRAALDSEHKLQLLQMQAINALWKKVISLQPSKLDESFGDVKDLAQTCDRLNSQVQQLQTSMEEVLRCVSPSGGGSAISTQTDIVAVRTPIEERGDCAFLYNRPSSLNLPGKVTQYSDCLVDGVLNNSVSASTAKEASTNMNEIE